MAARDDLPAGLARLWRRMPEARTGRPAVLSVGQVVATAVDLADRDGLAAVSLTNVARRLDVAKMALYRHIGSKDELVELMTDLAVAPAPESPRRADTWRGGVRSWAIEYRALYHRHPWLSQVPFSAPPVGPNSFAWIDAMLYALRPTGLDWPTKLRVLGVVSGYVRQSCAQAQELARGSRDPADLARYGSALAALVDPGEFPDAARLVASGIYRRGPEPPGEDALAQDFLLSLDVILDGIEATVTARGARS